MVLLLFNNLTGKDKSIAVERLVSASTPSQDFFLMVVLSILTATFGLLLDNVAVIIGSMLIAPILYPVLSLSLGIIMSDSKLVSRSFYTLLKGAVFGVAASAVATLLFASQLPEITPEIMSRTQASLPYIMIAIAAGLAGSFALVKPQLNETLQVKLWKDIEKQTDIKNAVEARNTARQLYAEVYRISVFQAAKLAHLRVLANIERNLAERGMGDHHWDNAEDYLEKFYSALKERVA